MTPREVSSRRDVAGLRRTRTELGGHAPSSLRVSCSANRGSSALTGSRSRGKLPGTYSRWTVAYQPRKGLAPEKRMEPTEVTDTNQRAAAVVEDWMRNTIEHRSDLRFDDPS